MVQYANMYSVERHLSCLFNKQKNIPGTQRLDPEAGLMERNHWILDDNRGKSRRDLALRSPTDGSGKEGFGVDLGVT